MSGLRVLLFLVVVGVLLKWGLLALTIGIGLIPVRERILDAAIVLVLSAGLFVDGLWLWWLRKGGGSRGRG